mmetsp:Transcript_15811/g.47609  ORF Transcript_15811/g.47609 Transcript_15811/m.47609 type:complete len:263 (+) Transcript_15811:242-1030(+)
MCRTWTLNPFESYIATHECRSRSTQPNSFPPVVTTQLICCTASALCPPHGPLAACYSPAVSWPHCQPSHGGLLQFRTLLSHVLGLHRPSSDGRVCMPTVLVMLLCLLLNFRPRCWCWCCLFGGVRLHIFLGSESARCLCCESPVPFNLPQRLCGRHHGLLRFAFSRRLRLGLRSWLGSFSFACGRGRRRGLRCALGHRWLTSCRGTCSPRCLGCDRRLRCCDRFGCGGRGRRCLNACRALLLPGLAWRVSRHRQGRSGAGLW